MNKLTILHVEDEDDISDFVKAYFENDAHTVFRTLTRQDTLDTLQKENIDIILLDYTLPETTGLEILKAVRKTSEIPVIMVSGRNDPIDKIVCIESGADDYVEKPFVPRELLARIYAVLKRQNNGRSLPETVKSSPQSQEKNLLKFGCWTLDHNRYQAFDTEKRSADLTTKEFILLEKMALSPHRTLSRATLLEYLDDDNIDIFDRAVDVYITRIRKKLGDDPKNPQYIQTVRNIGYMFCADTEYVSS